MKIFTQKTTILGCAAAALALFAAGCAKETSTDTSNVNKDFIQAWMSTRHPGINPTGLGVYILEDIPGTGNAITDDDIYLFTEYTCTDLDGNVSSTTDEKLSQQVGSFNAANYYGPQVIINSKSYTETGTLEMVKGMNIGGTRTAVVPGWLNITADYDTAEEYLKKGSGDNVIYTINIVGRTRDIISWEIDSLQRYVAKNMDSVDSLKFGYYAKTLIEPEDTTTFPSDTSFYINYTGRLLNGHVFDTNIEDTAKVHGIWSSSKTYSPTSVTNASDYTEITIGGTTSSEGSAPVDGFAYCLSKLRKHEKVVCAFYSVLGYSYSGSGSTIPGFAPLVFEIEAVDEP